MKKKPNQKQKSHIYINIYLYSPVEAHVEGDRYVAPILFMRKLRQRYEKWFALYHLSGE